MAITTPKIFSPSIADNSDWVDDLSFLESLQDKPSIAEHEVEGKLAVDVVQTSDEVLVIAPMAGTSADKIELHFHNDLLTIRGERLSPAESLSDAYYEECYWGKFSRSIVLPVDVKAEMAQAQYKNGVLLIRLPKARPQSEIPLLVVEE